MTDSASWTPPARGEDALPLPEPLVVRLGDMMRGLIAGGEAARVIGAGAALFEAGGKHVLSDGTRRAVRIAAERGATKAIAAMSGPLFEPAMRLVARPPVPVTLGGASLPSTGAMLMRGGASASAFAAKEIMKGAGKAAGVGFLIDGAVAGLEAAAAVRDGSADRATAARYVAREATTGAIATGAGVLLGAGLVALTGGLATPVVFAVSAAGSLGAKRVLRRFIGNRAVRGPRVATA